MYSLGPAAGLDVLQTKHDVPAISLYFDTLAVSGTRALWGWKDGRDVPTEWFLQDERD